MTRTHNGWAYLPEDGRPPRLIRQVILEGGLLATVDRDKNIVLVDGNYFNALDDLDQGRVLCTHVDLYVKERGGRVSIA